MIGVGVAALGHEDQEVLRGGALRIRNTKQAGDRKTVLEVTVNV